MLSLKMVCYYLWNHEKSYFLQSVKQPKWWSPNAVPKQIEAQMTTMAWEAEWPVELTIVILGHWKCWGKAIKLNMQLVSAR